MTDSELKCALALQNCSFLPGTYDKKFSHQLGNWYSRPMTEKGRAMMLKLVQKYRRQIQNAEKLIKAVNDDVRTTSFSPSGTRDSHELGQ